MSRKELRRGVRLPNHLVADRRRSQTRPYTPPILGIRDMIPEPLRVAHVTVLVVFSTRNRVGAGRVGDDEGEYEEDDSGDDQGGVTEQIK